jgi:photosynthetic reaction center cytochrome c subunit
MRNFTATMPAILLACAMAPQLCLAQTADVKTAETVFKNIVQLKGTPADQLQPAMQFIAASLGVDCAFCHVAGKPEADDKAAKKTAREMMAMTAMINKEAFHGRQQVTCNSCHRGAQRPVASPPVLEADAAPKPPMPAMPGPGGPPAPGAAPTGPTADQIVDKYIAAVGGADAIRKVTSRSAKGVTIVNGKETPIELFTKAPNLRLSVSHSDAASSLTAFDGSAGWMGSTGRPARDMSAAESWAAGLDAEFYLPLRLKEMFPQLRRGRPETVNGVECEALNGTAPGHPPVHLDFDAKTGLLVRLVRYAETPMGRNATQLDYADYRDADGVKIPFRWTLSRPVARFSIQLSEVKSNVDVDAAKFAKPSGEVK